MVFSNTSSLTEYRLKLNKENGIPEGFDGTQTTLYGVHNHLMTGVIEFCRVTKKHLYDLEGNQFPYPSGAANLTVFTSAGEAWKFYKSRLIRKQEALDAHYKAEMISLNLAYGHLNKCAETHPEFII